MPIANNPTGETHAASLYKVYSIGVWSILKFNNKNNKPIIIERINGFKNKFLIKHKNKKILFACDTGYGEVYKELGEKYGPIDLTMINIGAYNFCLLYTSDAADE